MSSKQESGLKINAKGAWQVYKNNNRVNAQNTESEKYSSCICH